MLHDSMPTTEEHLLESMRSAYVGFDPTSDSLHIGNLVPIMLLAHYQRCGHKPFALVGGATGMIGDPSGKSNERNLLSQEDLDNNIKGIHNQLSKFLDFDSDSINSAVLCNNNDWFKNINLINKKNTDAIFNALHGKDGEDGVAQSYFEYLKIPYTHSGVISSFNAMNKIISKKIFIKNKYYLLIYNDYFCNIIFIFNLLFWCFKRYRKI